MADSHPRLFRLFAAALRIKDPAKRERFLDDACAGDDELRRRVETMLKYGRHPEGDPPKKAPDPQVLADKREETKLVDHTVVAGGCDLAVGSLLADKYIIEELLGEGGMGRVYRARQVVPVRRDVAVKVIKADMDSKGCLSRFAIESQSLAMMDHPNIAQVFDAGTTEIGRPFFVMELVRGIPITKFCDGENLSIRRRLKLFVSVCEAIQHAHQKGIIHRDIKPSNVLVAKFEGQSVAKVIDFGLAKATTDGSSDGSLENSLGMILGTPEYMSPEQADFTSKVIDTRSDVYSLGALLLELITGKAPLDRQNVPEASMFDLLRMVREDNIPPASRRLMRTKNIVKLASQRSTKPRKLIRMVRGELDAIIAKALCKQIEGRYESANALARDIECYLKQDLVQAVSPTPLYRLAKMIRRNRFLVAFASLVVLTLFGGLTVSTYALIRKQELAESVRVSKNEAKIAHMKALASLNGERETSDKIRDRLAQINKCNEILSSIFTDLDRARIRFETEPLKAVLAKRLVLAAAKMEGEEIGDPSAIADMQHHLGVSLRKCGYSREAIPLLNKALRTRLKESGPVHPETLSTMEHLGFAFQDIGEFDRALELLKEIVRKRNASLGENHPESLRSAADLADCLRARGRVSEATDLFEKTRRLQLTMLGADHPLTLRSSRQLAVCYGEQGHVESALNMLKECWARSKSVLGDEHLDTCAVIHQLALTLKNKGEYEKSLVLADEAARIRTKMMGSEHPETLDSLSLLASLNKSLGKNSTSVTLYEPVLQTMRERFGNSHAHTIGVMNELATLYHVIGRSADAVPLLEELLRVRRESLLPGNNEVIQTMRRLVEAYQVVHRSEKVLPLLNQLHDLNQEKYGIEHPETVASLQLIADFQLTAGEYETAIQGFAEAVLRWRSIHGPESIEAIRAQSRLSQAFFAARHYNEASFHLNELITMRARIASGLPAAPESKNRTQVIRTQLEEQNWNHIAVLEKSYQSTQGDRSFDWVGPALYSTYCRLDKYNDADRHLTRMISREAGREPQRFAKCGFVGMVRWVVGYARHHLIAERLISECLAECEKQQPDQWHTDLTRLKLGMNAFALGNLDQAERLLLSGYSGVMTRDGVVSVEQFPRTKQGLDKLIKLYSVLRKPHEVRKWQEEKDRATIVWGLYYSDF